MLPGGSRKTQQAPCAIDLETPAVRAQYLCQSTQQPMCRDSTQHFRLIGNARITIFHVGVWGAVGASGEADVFQRVRVPPE